MDDQDRLAQLAALADGMRLDQWLAKEAVTTMAEEMLVLADKRFDDPLSLGRFAAKVFSQNYEDAIIAEIVARIDAPNKTFVEIGIGNGTENNTRFLLLQGWRGVWIEGDVEQTNQARETFARYIDSGQLQIVNAMVQAETVNALVDDALGGQSLDFLSLDIDLNTSHVWRALETKARFACIEYNATLPPTLPFEFAYEPDADWDSTNKFGASLKTLEIIGREKSMALVGCDRHGVNAFFVDQAFAGGKFSSPFTAEHHFQPARFSLARPRGHAPINEV